MQMFPGRVLVFCSMVHHLCRLNHKECSHLYKGKRLVQWCILPWSDHLDEKACRIWRSLFLLFCWGCISGWTSVWKLRLRRDRPCLGLAHQPLLLLRNHEFFHFRWMHLQVLLYFWNSDADPFFIHLGYNLHQLENPMQTRVWWEEDLHPVEQSCQHQSKGSVAWCLLENRDQQDWNRCD